MTDAHEAEAERTEARTPAGADPGAPAQPDADPDAGRRGLTMTVDLVLEIAALESEPSPGGGVRFRCSFRGRSIFGVCRRVPGRLVYVRDVGGERRAIGWTAIDDEDGLLAKTLDLLIWVSTG